MQVLITKITAYQIYILPQYPKLAYIMPSGIRNTECVMITPFRFSFPRERQAI